MSPSCGLLDVDTGYSEGMLKINPWSGWFWIRDGRSLWVGMDACFV